MRKDDYLATLIAVPPKQKNEIKPFSQKTTREAFSVSLEGLKGVCLASTALSPAHPDHPGVVEYSYVGSGIQPSTRRSQTEGSYRDR